MNGFRVVCPRDPDRRVWQEFRHPLKVVTACRCDEVIPSLEEMDRDIAAGRYVAGFMAYEAGPGLDAALRTYRPGAFPLLQFGVFGEPEPFEFLAQSGTRWMGDWRPELTPEAYTHAIDRIRRYLQAGDTYQVNFTFRMRSPCDVDPFALFARLQRAQQAPYACLIESDAFALVSASPELFFRLDGDRLESRPMKGTSPRGRTCKEDDALASELRASEKNRAENVMIVDMVRNDMGRIARAGSVAVEELFRVERFPTVLQMTSTVVSRSDAPLSAIVQALFPCASITGAPKIRTMEIIRELERSPRGVYTGCMGYAGPGRRALFNVAIRTVAIDKAAGQAEYGVGGGIVWDSCAESEYEECVTKARVLTAATPEFELLETLLWCEGDGYWLLDRHLDRLSGSARYFGVPLDEATVRRRLHELAATFGSGPQRCRLLVDRRGGASIEASALDAPSAAPRRVALAREPVDDRDPFLFHKTTHRDVYRRAAEGRDDLDDVLLWNARGEITESTIANVVVDTRGRRVTPPVSSGLLAGVLRAELLARGEIEEDIVPRERLREADRVWLINSVRGWMPAVVVSDEVFGCGPTGGA